MPSSESAAAGTASGEDSSFYKTQYEQLEAELADFQSSSRELEAELERDIEAAEKRERHLQEKIESLTYGVEEWKVCFLLTFAQRVFKMKLLLTIPMCAIEQIQAIEDRGKQCAECASEGDYGPTRDQQDNATQAPGHRSGQ